jgi:hypothetical protein
MVGVTAALIGSAVIGAGASAIGASKNSKAINRASQATQAANDQSVALQRDARDQNVTMQQPFYQTGVAANNRINALLGLGVPQQQPQPAQNFVTPAVMQFYNQGNSMMGAPFMMREDGMYNPEGMVQQGFQEAPVSQTNELQAAQDAFGDWRNNTGYQFRFNEGIRAIDAGAPVRNSGSTLKRRMEFGQGIGSAEFGNYFGALQDQQRVGVGAANALSGVQTTYANNASNLAMQSGQNAANAAVARANNTNNMISGITSSFGNALGAYGSMGGFGKSPAPTYAPAPNFSNWNGRY